MACLKFCPKCFLPLTKSQKLAVKFACSWPSASLNSQAH